MADYKILGKPRAGSLIPEFLFTELGVEYEIEFPNPEEFLKPNYRGFNPLGKIPVLICSDGTTIFESVAILNYITSTFSGLLPENKKIEQSIYWQTLALLSTTVYPAYHRQHHSYKYADPQSQESLKQKAQMEQAKIFDYLEAQLSPYLCGAQLTAVDFYFYAITRWDLNKTKLREGRPKLTSFLEAMRFRPSVDKVLASQPNLVYMKRS